MMTYLDCLKDELKYRYFTYLILSSALALGYYFNKGNINLGAFFAGCGLVIGSLMTNSYVRYRDKKISMGKSLTMTYLDYLKHELKYGYLRPLILSILTGFVLFFCNASYLMILLYSSGLFIVGLMLSAYGKKGYRRF